MSEELSNWGAMKCVPRAESEIDALRARVAQLQAQLDGWNYTDNAALRRRAETSEAQVAQLTENEMTITDPARVEKLRTNPFEFYETPHTFTRYLFDAMAKRRRKIGGHILEPCSGSRAIVQAAPVNPEDPLRWITNDIDTRWVADSHVDARELTLTNRVDWTVSNPPFSPAIGIIEHCLSLSRVGVAMHLRASIHEVLKTGERRTWMHRHTPTGILWLPRFAYQRSPTTGKWTTDSVGACWVIWLKEPAEQFIEYAPEWVIDDLDKETPGYRSRMDALMRTPAA